MTAVQFLFDEDLPAQLLSRLCQLEPAIRVLAVGQPEAPPKGTTDPELLAFAEKHKLAIVSRDKKTMPDHVRDHLAAGHHIYGVFLIREGQPLKKVAEDLLLIWSASDAQDWSEQLVYLPFSCG